MKYEIAEIEKMLEENDVAAAIIESMGGHDSHHTCKEIIRSLLAELKEVRNYKTAIQDALVVCCDLSETGDAKVDLHKLICYEIDIALDPRVSERAAQMIKKARKAAFLEAAEIVERLSKELRKKWAYPRFGTSEYARAYDNVAGILRRKAED
jgi:hypothetical protein